MLLLGAIRNGGTRRVSLAAFVVLAFSLICVKSSAQTQSYSPFQRPDPSQRYTLEGSVVNSVTGEPVPHALVEVNGRAVLTDAEGHFQIDGLPAMQVMVMARKPGFFSEQELHPQRPLTAVMVGPESKGITVKLEPEAILAGTVVDADGLPVGRIPVRVLQHSIVNGRREWSQKTQQVARHDGTFRIGNLMPGEYVLAVGPSIDRDMLMIGDDVPGIPETYYHGVPDRASASAIQLSAGQHADISVPVRLQPFFRIAGTVSGSADPRMLLELVSKGEGDSRYLQVDPVSGTFQDRAVPPGDYILRGRSQTADGLAMIGSVPVTVNSNVTGIHIAMLPAPHIPVIVDDRRQERTSTAGSNRMMMTMGSTTTSGRSRPQPVWVSLRSAEDLNQQTFAPSSSKDGSLVLSVLPGRYSAEIECHDPDCYVYSAQFGSTDVLKEDLVVRAASEQPLQVVIRNDGAVLNGKVVTSAPFVSATVLAIPEAASTTGMKTAFVGPDGTFSLSGLRPGTYSVLAVDRIDMLEYANPKTIEPYMSKATHVTVSPGDTTTLQLDLVTVGAD